MFSTTPSPRTGPVSGVIGRMKVILNSSVVEPVPAPVRVRTASAQDRAKAGLDFVRGLVDGTLPLNTMARTLGYDVVEASEGRVVVTATPTEEQLNPCLLYTSDAADE